MTLKSVVLILGIFFFGAASGSLVTRSIVQNRVEALKQVGTENGFMREWMRVIRPSEEQKEIIKPILQNFGASNAELRKTHKQDMRSLLKDLLEEVSPHLEVEQIERIKEHRQRIRERHSKPKPKPNSKPQRSNLKKNGKKVDGDGINKESPMSN